MVMTEHLPKAVLSKSIDFNLQGRNHNIEIEMEHGVESLEIGSGAYVKSKLRQQIPYSPKSEQEIAISGAWTSPDNYQMRIYFVKSTARLTYNFQFEDGKLSWSSQPEFDLFNRQQTAVLTGR